MCGIVFKHNFDVKKPVNNDILQQYDKQHTRGQRGFGVFDGQYMHIVREANEDNILKWLVKKDSNLILFHHRLPTSTVNVAKAAHPFSTKKFFPKTEYILVHNGIIRNADELWTAHQELGIRYTSLLEDLSFNDSEALMWDLALTLEGKQPKMKAYGDMAFICMKKVNGKLVDMLFGRNIRPLNMQRDRGSIALSSEGAGASITQDTLYTFNFKTRVTKRTEMEFPQFAPFRSTQTYPAAAVPNSGFRPPLQAALPLSAHAVHDDEFDSYSDYYEHKYGIKSATAGVPPLPKDPETNWERLRAKYGPKRLDTASTKTIGQILEAKRGKDGSYTVTEVKHDDMPVNIDNIDLRDYGPTAPEIQNCAMEYMIEAEGNFENAYALLEFAYAEFQEEIKGNETFSDVRQILLFESAMEFINSDPEYENEESKSSIWDALWAQKAATA